MAMKHLGRTGMLVSRLCLGNMMFGAIGNKDHDDCIKIIHHALDNGINFIDTADAYSAGESEVITGKALAGVRRESVILATKCHFPLTLMSGDTKPAPNTHGNSRRHIIRACEDSLRRLNTDWIDLYQLHRPDPHVAIEEQLDAMNDLVKQGKIRAFGCSTFPAEQTMEAAWVADNRNLIPFSTEQPPYSIFVRWIERDLLPTCQKLNMGTLVWSPLNGGWLSGTYRKGSPKREEGRAARNPANFDPEKATNQRKLEAVEKLQVIADDAGLTLPHMAVAWTLRHPGVTSAIIGPRIMSHLTTLIGSDEHVLPDDVLDAIDAVVRPGSSVLPDESKWEPPALKPQNRR